MSYEELSQEFGKQPVQIVELYLDKCSLSYGVAPCSAAIGSTGDRKCFNTSATCQDRSNYTIGTKVYRFATARIDGIQQPGDGPTFPTLMSVKTAPTILTPGKGLGVRSSLSINIQDHPWTDAGIDPYLPDRNYDPDNRGSFWGKFLSRNRFYENRRIDVLTGFLNPDGSYDAANFKRRTYIITKISGPNSSGTVTIDAKDPLKLADGEKAKWPEASQAVLVSNINNTQTSIALTDPELSVTEWWDAGQRYIRCEEEIMKATAITGSGTTTPTLTVVRGSMPTWYDFSLNVAYAHDINASVQPCWMFEDEPVYNIVYFFLNTVAGINPAYLPLSEWEEEINDGFQYLRFSTLLTEPVDVKTLLTEITELSVMIWWDERASVVRMRGLRFQQLIGDQINDDSSIVKDSVAITEDVKELTTQSWIYFDVAWPLADMDKLRSYRVVDIRANLEREDPAEYGRSAIRSIRTRWLPRSQLGVASEVGGLIVRQYQDVRKAISFTMDGKDDRYWTGDTIGLATHNIQDDTGETVAKNYLITQVEEMFTNSGVKYKYIALELFAFFRTGVITHPSGIPGDPEPAPPDYSAASEVEKGRWFYICYDPSSEFMTQESETLLTEEDIVFYTDGPQEAEFLDGRGAYQIV